MPRGGRHGNLKGSANRRYEGIRRGSPSLSKTSAAKIANKGKTKKGRRAMARKAARTRKRRRK
jgi:hypothetical protein